MNASTRTAGVITLSLDDNPPVTVDTWTSTGPQIKYVRSLLAVLQDPSWSHTDSNGHIHRWVLTRREALRNPESLPTLVASQRHIDCDGTCGNWDCGGYTITVWHCVTCGEQVEPGYIPDVEAQTTGIPIAIGPPEYTLTLDRAPVPGMRRTGPLQRDAHRAVLSVDDAAVAEGHAWIGTVEWGSEGERWEVHFVKNLTPNVS